MSANVLTFVLSRAAHDASFRGRLDRSPRAALWGYALTDAELEAIVARDSEALVALGAPLDLAASRGIVERSQALSAR